MKEEQTPLSVEKIFAKNLNIPIDAAEHRLSQDEYGRALKSSMEEYAKRKSIEELEKAIKDIELNIEVNNRPYVHDRIIGLRMSKNILTKQIEELRKI